VCKQKANHVYALECPACPSLTVWRQVGHLAVSRRPSCSGGDGSLGGLLLERRRRRPCAMARGAGGRGCHHPGPPGAEVAQPGQDWDL